jgi:hypothetical protein
MRFYNRVNLTFLAFMGLVFYINGCSSNSSEYQTDWRPEPTSFCMKEMNKDMTTSRGGQLFLKRTDLIQAGSVNFEYEADGSISYKGSITYLGNEIAAGINLPKFTKSFSGKYRAELQTLASETYKVEGSGYADFRLRFAVASAEGDLRTVDVKVIDDEATGVFTIDTKDDLIKINHAVIKGFVFGIPVTLEFDSVQRMLACGGC